MSIRIDASLRVHLRSTRLKREQLIEHVLLDDEVIVRNHDDRLEVVLAPGLYIQAPRNGGPFVVEGVELVGVGARPLPLELPPNIPLRAGDRLQFYSTTILTLFAPELS